METAIRLLNEGKNSCERFLEREIGNLAYYEATHQKRLAQNSEESIKKWTSRIEDYKTAISELEKHFEKQTA